MKKQGPAPFKIEWEAHEYEYKERSQDWFWAVGIVAVAIAVTSIIFHNIIFGILVLVGAFALSLSPNREPDMVEVTLNETGITRGKVRYPYESLHSFWIDTEHSHPKILLRSKKVFLPLIIIPLDPEAHVVEIERALARFLEEEHHTLPFAEKILEYLGF